MTIVARDSAATGGDQNDWRIRKLGIAALSFNGGFVNNRGQFLGLQG
jgi:hypothetical protein